MRLASTLLLLALAGCSSEDPPPATSSCEDFDTPYDAYVAGLTKTGEAGLVQVSLVEASPVPPAKGDNSWTVQVMDASGTPLSDATISDVMPFMPDHGHGATIEPIIGDLDAEGMAEIQQIDFRMPGVWTVDVEVTTASDDVDRAVFGFCIDG